jgi:P27 family predicted phage terminase small subunit
MGKRGPAKKPTALKIVQGTAQPSRINADEPVVDAPVGAPFEDMLKSEQEQWREIAATCFWLTEADRHTLRHYCETWQDYQSERGRMKAKGSVYKAKSGYAQSSAYFGNVMKLRDELRRLAGELGLTPAARTNIKAPKKEQTVGNKWAVNGK